MIEDARGIVVATTHEALRAAMEDAGATAVGSVRDLEEAIVSGAAAGVLASQEFPGLTPDLVKQWGARGLPVLVWLETAPPPSWQGRADGVERVSGEMADDDINAWLRGARDATEFGRQARVLGVLGLGWPVSDLVAVWGMRLSRLRGPGLLIDADWGAATLTERLAAHVWTRIWDYRSGRTLPVPAGHLMPAPPPWEEPRDDGARVDQEQVLRAASWVMVDLGSDFRRRPAIMWIARIEALAVDAGAASPSRIQETVSVLQGLNAGMVLGVRRAAAFRMEGVVALGGSWPRGAGAGPEQSGSGRSRLRQWVAGILPRR